MMMSAYIMIPLTVATDCAGAPRARYVCVTHCGTRVSSLTDPRRRAIKYTLSGIAYESSVWCVCVAKSTRTPFLTRDSQMYVCVCSRLQNLLHCASYEANCTRSFVHTTQATPEEDLPSRSVRSAAPTRSRCLGAGNSRRPQITGNKLFELSIAPWLPLGAALILRLCFTIT